jgi:ATP diphosphatase
MEALARAAGTSLEALSLTEQDALWDQVKTAERGPLPAAG